jgi:hypothetical protein
LRELRFTSPEIAETLGMPLSTVGAVLSRNGLGKLPRLKPDEPANSYERPRPGELVHVDVKKLGRIGRPGHRVNGDRTTRARGTGWEYVHVAVDDATRLAYVEVLDDERGATAAGFLRRVVRFFRRWGIYRTSSERAAALAGWLDWYNRLSYCSRGASPGPPSPASRSRRKRVSSAAIESPDGRSSSTPSWSARCSSSST